MLPAPSPSPEPASPETLALGLDHPAADEVRRLAGFLAGAFGTATVALIHYGSHAQGMAPGPASAFDFFVLVDDTRGAYRSLAAALPRGFPSGRAAFLNRILPPNVISVAAPELGIGGTAKCCVLGLRDLRRACGPRPADHFVRARLFQQVHLVWARDAAAREAVSEAIVAARGGTFAWGRPFLPGRFDSRDFFRTLLEVSYAAEIRPEDPGHVERLVEAQAATLLPVLDALLREHAAAGELERDAEAWRDRHPPGRAARAFARAWFRWSKLRATLRWAKYIALYEDWLDYVLLKVERRSGERLVLTERERRWPLVFLWPKALRYLGRQRERRS